MMEDRNIQQNISEKELNKKAIENARKVIEIINKNQNKTKENGDER